MGKKEYITLPEALKLEKQVYAELQERKRKAREAEAAYHDANFDEDIDGLAMLGEMDDPETHVLRLLTLCGELFSSNGRKRYGAATGLSYLDDIKAKPFLEAALKLEDQPMIKKVIAQVLEYLG